MRFIIFEKVSHIRSFIVGKNIEQTIFITTNIKTGLHLRNQGKTVYFPEEVFSPEDVREINEKCLKFIQEVLFSDGKDYIQYKGNSLGHCLEYVLIPYFMKIFRNIHGLELLYTRLSPDEIIVIAPGEFCRIAVEFFTQKKIPFKAVNFGLFKSSLYMLKKLWEGKETKWIGTNFRSLVVEPFFIFLLIFRGLFYKIKRGGYNKKPLIVLTGDRFTYPIYNKLKSEKRFVVAGSTLPGRKLFFRENVPSIEEYIKLNTLLEFSKGEIYFMRMWSKAKKDRKLHEKFEYRSVNFWPIVKNVIMAHMVISLPIYYMVCHLSKQLFKEGGLLLMSTDVTGYNRALLMGAQDLGIKSLIIQHGLLLEPNGHDKILADILMAWGNASIKWYEKKNDPSKIIVTGNPRFDIVPELSENLNPDAVRSRLNIPKDKKVVTIFTEFTDYFSADSSELDNFYRINTVVEALQAEEIKFIVKLHPGETLEYYKEFNKVLTKENDIMFIRDFDLYELLSITDIVVTGYSTVVLEAMFLKKPAIIYSPTIKRKMAPFVDCGVAFGVSSADDIKKALNILLCDHDIVKRIIKKQEKFIEEYAYKIDGKSTGRVCELIEHQMR